MTTERWRRIEQLFDLVADLPAEGQSVRLKEECGDDTELFDEVTHLLRCDREGGVGVAEAIQGLASIPPPAETNLVGRKMGPYRIVREVGRGGMGVVFEAERDDDQYNKRVALKVAVKAAYSPEFLDRFRNERQILAQLEHPHIARLLDGGTTIEGIPFFAMEFVEGMAIDSYAEREKLPVRARVELFLQVCEAVEYAHQSLVIHRDLKPGNILVAGNVVRLLDFGIAKLAGGDQTQTSISPATPDYCSPEQVLGKRVTTRSDVYALGLVLYKLLTGVRAQEADASSAVTLQRSICEHEPVAPSERVATNRGLAKQLRGDLDTIVMMAVRKEPERRYSSAASLAEDLRRYLDGRPIAARQDNSWYRVNKFVRRHWIPLAGVLLLVATLVGGIVATSYQARLAQRRFEQVRKLAQSLTGEVYRSIRNVPATSKAQETVVRTALEYLNGLSKEAGNDRNLQFDLAKGYAEIAKITYSLNQPSLGRAGEARLHYEKARDILLALHRADPENTNVAQYLVSHLNSMALFLDNMGQPQEGFWMLERAISIAEESMRRAPGSNGLVRVAALAHGSMIGRYMATGAARKYLDRFLEVSEEAVRRNPNMAGPLSALASAHGLAGNVKLVEGDEPIALEHYRRSLELHRKAALLNPDNPVSRRNVALAMESIAAWWLGPLGPLFGGGVERAIPIPEARRKEALQLYEQVKVDTERLHRQDPNDLTLRHDHAIMLARQAIALPEGDRGAIPLLEQAVQLIKEGGKDSVFLQRYELEFRNAMAERRRQMGEFAKAELEWRAAEAIAGRMIAAQPKDPFARRYMIPAYRNWAMALAERKDAAGAVRTMRKAETRAAELLQTNYLRGPRFAARVQGWLADLYAQLGDRASGEAARAESLRLWRQLAARTDMPKDVLTEARGILAKADAEVTR